MSSGEEIFSISPPTHGANLIHALVPGDAAFCISDKTNDNYAYFRFFGGVTDPARRSRRAKFIAEALEKNDFNVDLRGDLVVGRIKKLSIELMEWKMHLLGQLVAFTRQLDVQMNSDRQIGRFVGEFEQLVKMVNQIADKSRMCLIGTKYYRLFALIEFV